MKQRLLSRIAMGTAILLPLGGISFAATQALGVQVAGASTGNLTLASGSDVIFDVGGSPAAEVDLSTGTVNGGSPGVLPVNVTGMTSGTYVSNNSPNHYPFVIVGPFGNFCSTVTIPDGDISGTWDASGITSLVIGPDPSITVSFNSPAGCDNSTFPDGDIAGYYLNNITPSGGLSFSTPDGFGGLNVDDPASTGVVSASIGVIGNACTPYDPVAMTGTCTASDNSANDPTGAGWTQLVDAILAGISADSLSDISPSGF